jgi:hypothetical protein
MQQSFCFQQFGELSSSGNIHVDSPATSSKNVVILSDLPYMKLDLDLLHVCPPQNLKKSYDHTKKF